MSKNEKAKLTMKALEELLQKIENDIKRARLLIHSLITNNFDNLENLDENQFKELAKKLVNYEEDQAIKVIE
jgi:hypothetical protein